MTRRKWLGLVLFATLSSCGQLSEFLPRVSDGGQLQVPGTYLDARIAPGHRAHLALTGDRQLSCHDCHAIADAGFTSHAVVACANCHQPQQAHHHPFDGGLPMTCTSCHVFRSIGEAAKIDKWGCRRCHVEPMDAGVGSFSPPHVAVHVKKCEACHRPHGTPFTQAADCGLCHDVVVAHGKGEKAHVADTCMACHGHHREASLANSSCVSCHVGSRVAAKAQVKPGALFEKGHPSCSTCHPPHAFVAAQVVSCTTCHANTLVLAAQKHDGCVTCHRPHEERAAPKGCESCHAKVDPQHPPDALGRSCLGCHPVHSSALSRGADSNLLAVPCIGCHNTAPYAAAVIHASESECASCHETHQGKPRRDVLCRSCHEEEFALVKRNRGHQDCGSCHSGLPHGPPVAPKPCLSCHSSHQPPIKAHADQLQCASCHQPHSGGLTKSCADCHAGANRTLPGLHAVEKHRPCLTCHAAHLPEPGVGPKTCRSCHLQLSTRSHPTPPQQCVSCHLFSAPKR